MSGLRWTAATRLLAQVVTWAATFIVVRHLSPGDYGLVAMASIVSAYLELIGELGVGQALVQQRLLDTEKLRPVFGALLAAGVIMFVVAASAAPIVMRVFNNRDLVGLSLLSALQFLLLPFGVIPSSKLSIELRFKELGFIGVLTAVIGSIATLALAYRGFGPYSLLVGTLLSTLSRLLYLNFLAPYLHRPQFSWKAVKKLVGFSAYVLGERSIWYWYAQADSIIIGYFMGASSLGLFAIAKQLAVIPLEKFSQIVNTVALPTFSAINDDDDRFLGALIKAFRIASVFAFPMFFGLAMVSQEVVILLIGRKWQDAIPILQILCVSMPLRLVASISSPVAVAKGRPDVSMKLVMWCALWVPTGMVVGIRWGLEGLAIAWAVSYPIAFYFGMVSLSSAFSVRISRMLVPILPPALSAFFMALALGLSAAVAPTAGNPVLGLLIKLPFGVLCYGIALRVLSKRMFNEAVEFMLSGTGLGKVGKKIGRQ